MLDWEMLRRFKIERGVFFSEIGKPSQQAQRHDPTSKRKKNPCSILFLKTLKHKHPQPSFSSIKSTT
jgi:hypothetical protein